MVSYELIGEKGKSPISADGGWWDWGNWFCCSTLFPPYRWHFDSWPTVLIDKQTLIGRLPKQQKAIKMYLPLNRMNGWGSGISKCNLPVPFAPHNTPCPICCCTCNMPPHICSARSFIVSMRLWWLCRFTWCTRCQSGPGPTKQGQRDTETRKHRERERENPLYSSLQLACNWRHLRVKLHWKFNCAHKVQDAVH